MKKLTKLEWEILQNLADDFECPTTLCPEIEAKISNITRNDILKTLYSLFSDKLIFIKKGIENINPDELLSEQNKKFDTKFWFGMTAKGCKAWENQSMEFFGESVTWKNAWSAFHNFQEKIGFIDGVNREVCIEALKTLHPGNWEEKINDKLFEEHPIDGFHAKYYKYIKGGYRIKYDLNEKSR